MPSETRLAGLPLAKTDPEAAVMAAFVLDLEDAYATSFSGRTQVGIAASMAVQLSDFDDAN